MYHQIGTLLPQPQSTPAFAQIYLCAPDAQRMQRQSLFNNTLNDDIYAILFDYLNLQNRVVKLFSSFALDPRINSLINYKVVIKPPTKIIDKRRYNLPVVDEIAVIMHTDDNHGSRDIVIQSRTGGPLQRISDLHPDYDSLAYPLLFFKGEPGWYPELKLNVRQEDDDNSDNDDDNDIVNDDNNKSRLTAKAFTAFRLQVRPSTIESNHLHLSRHLFHQWIVDQYVKIEHGRLSFLEYNQPQLRAELYQGLADAVRNGDVNMANQGKLIVLPSSYIGSPRFHSQLYQDAMAIVRKYGKPDLFITITCNPAWPEIKSELEPGQSAVDRPDLVSRIFNIKLKDILKDITIKHCFGEVEAYCYSIEFQKRGLPHCHLLLILKQAAKPRTADHYDLFVSAEIPNPVTQTELFKTVMTCMLHRPCSGVGNFPCRNGTDQCAKKFPKQFCELSKSDCDGFPTYRRRQLNPVIHNGTEYCNADVIPYNPYLCQTYNCHINVEICSTVKSVKYIYKYIYKGNDCAIFDLEHRDEPADINEIKNYRDSRYVSAHEAIWRIFGFKLYNMSHSVQTLQIHLENQHLIVYNQNLPPGDVEDLQTKSQLIQFFLFCIRYSRQFSNVTYPTIFDVATWKDGKQFVKRKKKAKVIGRMYTVAANSGEKLYLRILLHHVKCPKSYQDVRTTNLDGIRVIHDTFKEACLALGLLDNDNEWLMCMTEAEHFKMPYQLRGLLATIMVFAYPINLLAIWTAFYQSLSEDFAHKELLRVPLAPQNNLLIEAQTLNDLSKILTQHGKTLDDFPELPILNRDLLEIHVEQLIEEETTYEETAMNDIARNLHRLNDEQKVLFDSVLQSVQNGPSKQFFVDGPGGTGKTFLYSMILSHIRLTGKVVLAVASSGIAALLLDGGRTGHSRFKIPLDISADSVCHVKRGSELSRLIEQCALIIWDEVPMTHRYCYEALDRTLRDIMKSDHPFGGKTILFGGDFRQILPVIPKASRSVIVNASIKKSILWTSFETFKLSKNMRLLQNTCDPNASDFASYLLRVGDGVEREHKIGDKCLIALPICMTLEVNTVHGLIQAVYDDFFGHYNEIEYLNKRSLLTPKNADVDLINSIMLSMIPGDERIYLSADSVEEADDINPNLYPIELLNGINENGIPPHILKLKIGTPVMILRNLNPKAGEYM